MMTSVQPQKNKKPHVRCFMDITIDDNKVGRIVFELREDIAPRTVENFRCLCTGEKGFSKLSGSPLHYKGSPFHRVIKGFMIQGGDTTKGNGTGGESIYGRRFDDEWPQRPLGADSGWVHPASRHDRKYLLSMANAGKNTNGSQFFITTAPAPHLDGKHVVFGRVIQGKEVVDMIESQPVDSKNSRPFSKVVVADCGELVFNPKVEKEDKKPEESPSASSSPSRSSSSSRSRSSSSSSSSSSKSSKSSKSSSGSTALKNDKRSEERREKEEEDVVDPEKKMEEDLAEKILGAMKPKPFLDRTIERPKGEQKTLESRSGYDRFGKKFRGRGMTKYSKGDSKKGSHETDRRYSRHDDHYHGHSRHSRHRHHSHRRHHHHRHYSSSSSSSSPSSSSPSSSASSYSSSRSGSGSRSKSRSRSRSRSPKK